MREPQEKYECGVAVTVWREAVRDKQLTLNLRAQTGFRPFLSPTHLLGPKLSTVDIFVMPSWAAPLKAYGSVLRTPLPCVHYQTICIQKNVLTAALPPFVEAAA